MNKEEVRQNTKKLLSSPFVIVVACLLVASIVADAIITIINKEFSILGFALGHIFTIFFAIFAIMLIVKKDDASKASALEGARKTLKVKLILSIIGLAIAIFGCILIFIAFSIINQGMIDSMDIEEKYRTVLQGFLDVKKVFLLAALFLGGELAITIGFYSSFGKTLKNVKYATFEEGHYHKGHALAAAIWGFLFVVVTVASVWSGVWLVKGLLEPLKNLETIIDGFTMPQISVSITANLYKFITAAAIIALIITLVMHYINCDKLVEEHAEAKEEPKEAEVEEVKEAEVEEVKEEAEEPKE